MEFSIKELRDIISYKDARRILAKLHNQNLVKRTKQTYEPYSHPKTGVGTTRLASYSVFDIDECIEYYEQLIKTTSMRHMFHKMKGTIKELYTIKEKL